MDTNTELETRQAFVVHVRGKGFIKNKHGSFTPDFEKARLYGRKSDADNSVTMGNYKSDEAYVIPVDMTLDPKRIFKAVLAGK